MKEEDERGGREVLNLLSPEGEAEMDPAVPSHNQTKKVNNMKHRGRTGKLNGSILFKVARRETRMSFDKRRKGEDI